MADTGWLVAMLVLFLVVVAPLYFALRGVRDAVERQTRILERMGQAQGWLPPRR